MYLTNSGGGVALAVICDTESTATFILDVMANDAGGQAKTLYSLDDGIENEGSATSADLLIQDAVGVDNFDRFSAADFLKVCLLVAFLRLIFN